MSKKQLKSVLSLAQGDNERALIRYTAVAASGVSASGARKHYGFDGVNAKMEQVENALQEAEAVHCAFESVVHVQEAATLALFGIDCNAESDFSSGSSEGESDDDTAGLDSLAQSETREVFSRDEMIGVLKAGTCNWFELVAVAEERGVEVGSLENEYDHIIGHLTDQEHTLLQQSHAAYVETEKKDAPSQAREAEALNGNIVSESESDNPDSYVATDKVRALLKKKIEAIRKKCRRDRAKLVAQKHFLRRKQSKKVKGIVATYPDIGKTIEEYFQETSVGADAWRRTGGSLRLMVTAWLKKK